MTLAERVAARHASQHTAAGDKLIFTKGSVDGDEDHWATTYRSQIVTHGQTTAGVTVGGRAEIVVESKFGVVTWYVRTVALRNGQVSSNGMASDTKVTSSFEDAMKLAAKKLAAQARRML